MVVLLSANSSSPSPAINDRNEKLKCYLKGLKKKKKKKKKKLLQPLVV